jgi:hypothetical protein
MEGLKNFGVGFTQTHRQGIEHVIKLCKPKQRVNNTSWNQNGAWMNYKQQFSQYSSWPRLGKKAPPLPL